MRCEGVQGVALRRSTGEGRIRLRCEGFLNLCRDSTSGKLSRIRQMSMGMLLEQAAVSFRSYRAKRVSNARSGIRDYHTNRSLT